MPYRVYNTQAKGNYGSNPKSPAAWQSFSNWCPGAKIPIRTINLGNLTAGPHSFKISVPTAVFQGSQGYFPVSVYLQGDNTVLSVPDHDVVSYDIYPNPSKETVNINCSNTIKSLQLFDMEGRLIETKIVNSLNSKFNISNQSKGVYFLKIQTENGLFSEKIMKE